MKETWKKIALDIIKYAVGAILGGIGVAASGCSFVPVFSW